MISKRPAYPACTNKLHWPRSLTSSSGSWLTPGPSKNSWSLDEEVSNSWCSDILDCGDFKFSTNETWTPSISFNFAESKKRLMTSYDSTCLAFSESFAWVGIIPKYCQHKRFHKLVLQKFPHRLVLCDRLVPHLPHNFEINCFGFWGWCKWWYLFILPEPRNHEVVWSC